MPLEIVRKSLVVLFKEKRRLVVPEKPLVSVTFLSDSAFSICAEEEIDTHKMSTTRRLLIKLNYLVSGINLAKNRITKTLNNLIVRVYKLTLLKPLQLKRGFFRNTIPLPMKLVP